MSGRRASGRRKSAPAAVQAAEQPSARGTKRNRDESRAIRESAFDAYATSALWAWGCDYGGWPLNPSFKKDRERILSEIVNNADIDMPKDESEMAEAWRRREDVSNGIDPFPTRQAERDAAAATPALSIIQSAISSPSPPHTSISHASEPPIKRFRHDEAAAAAASSSSIADQLCRHCGTSRSSLRGACGECGLYQHIDVDEGINKMIWKTRHGNAAQPSSASAASGESESRQSHIERRKVVATAFEKALESQEVRAPPSGALMERFAATTAITPAMVFEELRTALMGDNFERPLDQLVQLVQSGKLSEIGFAVPRTAEQARDDRHNSSKMAVTRTADGLMSLEATAAVQAQLVPDFRTFAKAMFGVIIPSLIDRQRPLLDWLKLTHTVMRIEEMHGWEAARDYLSRSLEDAVLAQREFGSVRDEILRTTKEKFGSQRTTRPHLGEQSAPSYRSLPLRRDICRDWNFGPQGCAKAECRYPHECAVVSCANPAAHPANAHPTRGGEALPRAPASRGRQRGSAGRGRDRKVGAAPRAKAEGATTSTSA